MGFFLGPFVLTQVCLSGLTSVSLETLGIQMCGTEQRNVDPFLGLSMLIH